MPAKGKLTLQNQNKLCCFGKYLQKQGANAAIQIVIDALQITSAA